MPVVATLLLILLLGMQAGASLYARGTAQIVSSPNAPRLAFVNASTNDPGRRVDPGGDMHLGSCRARLKGGRSLSATLYGGYPGYSCTIHATIVNRGSAPAYLFDLVMDAPPALSISVPAYAAGLALLPGERLEQEIVVRVKSAALENERYTFAIWQFFGDRAP
jgi:hypothetical protein